MPPLATAEQVAATIIYLLSEEASNINGAIIARAAGRTRDSLCLARVHPESEQAEKGAEAGYWQVKYG